MFDRALRVEREFVGVRTVRGKKGFLYKRYASTGINSPRIFEGAQNISDPESSNTLRIFYNRNFLLFGKSIRNTSSEWTLPPKDYLFRAFVYRTMRNRLIA